MTTEQAHELMSSLEGQYRERFEGLDAAARLALYRPIEHHGIHMYRDGREECSLSVRGKREYQWRTLFVYLVYGRKCRLCDRMMGLSSLTADHIIPRGSGGSTRDDRVHNLWPAHYECNGRRGSRRVYEHQYCPFCNHDVVIGLIYPECFKCQSKW